MLLFAPRGVSILKWIYLQSLHLPEMLHSTVFAYVHFIISTWRKPGSSPNQGATPLGAAGFVSASADNNLSGIYRSPPRPLPYEADSRYAHLQCDGLVSRREKASSHFQEESEPLRSSNSGAVESIQEKRNGADYEGHSKIIHPDSSGRHLLAKIVSGVTFMFPSSEDEDVCPTCLEEYTPEDPKIITQCSHHFHLGCIYEWMERSDNCPVCGKEMVFSESP